MKNLKTRNARGGSAHRCLKTESYSVICDGKLLGDVSFDTRFWRLSGAYRIPRAPVDARQNKPTERDPGDRYLRHGITFNSPFSASTSTACLQRYWKMFSLRTRLPNIGIIGSLAKEIAKSSSACDNAATRTFSLSRSSRELIVPASTDQHKSKKQVTNKGLFSGLEDMLFYTITEGAEKVPVSHFIAAVKSTGLLTSDPRLRDCMEKIRQAVRESAGEVTMDRELFRKCVGGNIVLLSLAFRRKFIIPEFEAFVGVINHIYYTSKVQHDGQVAKYIPHLTKFSPDLWGVSLCTVDGQRHSVGDTKVPFCLQSCVKPLEYAMAVHEHGTERIHHYVGKEPSGFKFNKLSLDEENKPHNPMVNAGAIVISSLIKPGVNKAEKFDYVMDFVKKMTGREYVGFSNATFQSEKETGDRNYAIGYYLKEKKCFPVGADMIDALDFYFQLCAIEVTCESGSVMAATLANGGICPITGERVLSTEAVRNTLSLMHSCGMYDYSGQFAFHVGLPAKSGVSGAVLLVVPNVMGVMCWSPPVDKVGNSVRGIRFCQELVSLFNFHNYDNLKHFLKKQDPRRQSGDDRNKSVVNLMFAAHSGDVSALRRFALSSMDMELKDYDSRTPLHIAAAEGHMDVVLFLTQSCKVNPLVKDRWGNIPRDDAMQFGRKDVAKILEEYEQNYSLQMSQIDTDDRTHQSKLSSLEG
ncbi:glutaminase 2b isoform X2 [Puntigrus tetrazona]|uniref:glutaminase 2b isoform X2 n=1 Tax=Puntigrus tetrazona TaxID=1606681 RepID=UPI001C8AC5AA|nr:glutaminase 2b isoform X2 [Puntigrus tetrazona]